MKLRENFEGDIKLSQLPSGEVQLVIPEKFVDKKTGEIDIDKFILELAYGDINLEIEYEVKET